MNLLKIVLLVGIGMASGIQLGKVIDRSMLRGVLAGVPVHSIYANERDAKFEECVELGGKLGRDVNQARYCTLQYIPAEVVRAVLGDKQ